MNLSRNGSTTTQACAVCKYQRRKCTPDCILAPYFPHDRQTQFLNAHKLFGVSNITKIIKDLEPFQKDEAMRSIIYQSDVRAWDPVGGCYRIIQELQTQIEYHKAELELVLQQLAIVRAQAKQQQSHLLHHHHQMYMTELTNSAASTVINMNVGGDDMLNNDALSLYNPAAGVQFHYSQPQDPFQMATAHTLNPNSCSVQEDSSNSWVVQNTAAMSSLSLHDSNEFESKALLEIPSDHRNDFFRFDIEELADRSDELYDQSGQSGVMKHTAGDESVHQVQDHDLKGNEASADTTSSSLWLALNPSKRWGELFFLIYTPFWLTLCLGIVVPYKLYENFTELEYMLIGLVSAVPAFLIPMVIVGKADKNLSWKDRYWVKANLWIIIFSYVGNYFWTHYFFTVLGASYTFPSWKMNNVPHTTFLLAHVCFLFYHVTSNMTLRRLRHAIAGLPKNLQWITEAAWILAFSYFIAYLETLSISNFPYYDFVDREAMYKIGSLFYAIYFIVSFPMFLRIDEKSSQAWDLPRVAIDALGAAMLVTIILDLWRIFLGPIVPVNDTKQCPQTGLPWFSAYTQQV